MSQEVIKETQYEEFDEHERPASKMIGEPAVHITPVHLEYLLFMENPILDEASCKSSQPSPNKLWSQMISKPPLVPMPINLQATTWTAFKSAVIQHLGPTQDYFDAFLQKIVADGLVHWIGMISGNTTYSIKRGFELKDDLYFMEFAKVAVRTYPAKVVFHLQMEDPKEIIKSRSQGNQMQNLLTMKFGPPAVCSTLEHQYKRQLVNNKADVGARHVHVIVADLRESIRLNSNSSNLEYPAFVNPENPLMEMQILHKQLWDWAHAIKAGEPGVDLTHPPHGPKFPDHQWRSTKGPHNLRGWNNSPTKDLSDVSRHRSNDGDQSPMYQCTSPLERGISAPSSNYSAKRSNASSLSKIKIINFKHSRQHTHPDPHHDNTAKFNPVPIPLSSTIRLVSPSPNPVHSPIFMPTFPFIQPTHIMNPLPFPNSTHVSHPPCSKEMEAVSME